MLIAGPSAGRTICLVCANEYSGSMAICAEDGALLVPVQRDPLVGQKLGYYEIQDWLGYGATATVYKARHSLMSRTVAIKVLYQHLVDDDSQRLRLQRETAAIGALDHHNIVTLFDCGMTESGQPYMVLDYLPGASLEDLIDRRGRVPVNMALPIFSQVCDALDHAHKRGVIHQDLKPGNIVIDGNPDGEFSVKVVDFGVAKFMPWSGVKSAGEVPGRLAGTPLYMSPEHSDTSKTDNRSDVYSLGVVMYEALTGALPFSGRNVLDLLYRHKKQPPPSLKNVRPDLNIPDSIEQIIMKALSKSPDDRYQSTGEMKLAIDKLLHGDVVVDTGKSLAVLIVDDVTGARLAVRRMVEDSFEVVGEAADGIQAIEFVSRLRPHVVVMDLGMPGLDGFASTQRIKERFPDVKVLIHTTHEASAEVHAAIAHCKADGYCLKTTDRNKLCNAIRAVHVGATWLDGGLGAAVFNTPVPDTLTTDVFADCMTELGDLAGKVEFAAKMALQLGHDQHEVSKKLRPVRGMLAELKPDWQGLSDKSSG